MKNGVYEGEGRLRKAVEGRLEVLRRSMMMLMDTQERVRADMDRIVVNTVLNNKAGVQPLAAVEQNQVPTRVAIHREIIGPSNRKGPADQPAWSRSMSRPMANEPSRLKSQLEIPPYRAIKREADPPQKDRPQWFGTRNKTTVSRVEAKSHPRKDRKQSPSAKRRAVEEVQSEMKVTEQSYNKKQDSDEEDDDDEEESERSKSEVHDDDEGESGEEEEEDDEVHDDDEGESGEEEEEDDEDDD
ncbi:hypothetical protein Q3G72_022582 [Acer saccharum]|nr:hypothetical protein Q3G72_022582 [Acer saccharum]